MQKFQNCIEHLIGMLGKMYLSKYIKRENKVAIEPKTY